MCVCMGPGRGFYCVCVGASVAASSRTCRYVLWLDTVTAWRGVNMISRDLRSLSQITEETLKTPLKVRLGKERRACACAGQRARTCNASLAEQSANLPREIKAEGGGQTNRR